MLNFELLENINFNQELDENEQKKIDELYCAKLVAEGVTYKLFAVALLYIEDIEDDNITYLEPKEKVSKEQIRDFFKRDLND